LYNIFTHSQVERPVPLRDLVLDVQSGFFHIRVAVKWVQGAARTGALIVQRWSRPRQVVAAQQGNERSHRILGFRRILLQTRGGALRWIGETGNWIVVPIQARRVEQRSDDSQLEILREKRLLIRKSRLHIVNPFHTGEIEERNPALASVRCCAIVSC
jgi:hypothetical protein